VSLHYFARDWTDGHEALLGDTLGSHASQRYWWHHLKLMVKGSWIFRLKLKGTFLKVTGNFSIIKSARVSESRSTFFFIRGEKFPSGGRPLFKARDMFRPRLVSFRPAINQRRLHRELYSGSLCCVFIAYKIQSSCAPCTTYIFG
jgi:hypothetical protein